MTPAPVDRQTVGLLAEVVGIAIPDADLPSLTAAFANELGGIAALDELELGDVEPIVGLDPRWR